MNASIFGIIGGLLFVTLFFLIRMLCKKKRPCDYDERQRMGRGRAFQAGFFTMLLAGAIVACLDFLGVLPGSGLLWHMGALLLGVAVFAVTAIHYDAYVGLHEKAKSYYIGGSCIFAAMILNGVVNLGSSDPDRVTLSILDFQVAALWVVILIALLVHRFRSKEEE